MFYKYSVCLVSWRLAWTRPLHPYIGGSGEPEGADRATGRPGNEPHVRDVPLVPAMLCNSTCVSEKRRENTRKESRRRRFVKSNGEKEREKEGRRKHGIRRDGLPSEGHSPPALERRMPDGTVQPSRVHAPFLLSSRVYLEKPLGAKRTLDRLV